ncbi:GerMN domain-containing protein [Virgibacillus sp. C22-A2]|uniref:GerMN domain-containing protein n=1 Tax=Virgibacillus tibetensis TaxID=3042313 RepID=A0ABU6KA39_9BACI|nr:GerMN domain-containing protein [Virgibacillus sp. C22-A2]
MLKRGLLLTGAITLSVLLTGCFQGEQSMEEMDPPEDAVAVDNLEEATQEEGTEEVDQDVNENSSETVARQLYLIDSNGMVASQIVELPNLESKEVATQVLEHLVEGGPITPLLPNGFRAVLPAGTEILGLNLQEDGTMIVDVSSEFEDYEADDELKIIEAMTHTLTQFENVDKIQLRINGYPQSEMPVNGTPIGDGYSRVNGINLINTDNLDIINSKAVTMYYPAEHNENRYYVPVTQYVEGENEEIFRSIVQAMIDGPGFNTNIKHVFNTHTLLTNTPSLESGVLELVFNKEILKDMEKSMISDEVMETLVRTLTEQQAVEAVQIKVEDVEQLVNENGEVYSEPVTNQTFMSIEKL